MSIVYHYVDKETFEPEKNYFSIEKVRVSRKETSEELELWDKTVRWSSIGFHCIGWGCLIGLIFMITFGILGSSSPWFYIGAAVGGILFVGGIVFANAVCWPKENEAHSVFQQYHKDHEEELWAEATAEVRAYNEEQKKIAEAWRAEHPLEEKIRACIKDPMSSVDIANLARYYAEEYIKDGVSHETVVR
jgi:hypothetical protein